MEKQLSNYENKIQRAVYQKLCPQLEIKHNDSGFIIGYASRFGIIDKQRDIVAHGAFRKTLRAWRLHNEWPKMLWQHNPLYPIGRWHKLQEDDKGLYVEGQLILDVPKARQAYSLLKKGILDGLSIGFRTVESSYDPHKRARTLLDVNLLEISLVTFAANAQARIHSVKSRACQGKV